MSSYHQGAQGLEYNKITMMLDSGTEKQLPDRNLMSELLSSSGMRLAGHPKKRRYE